MNLKELSIEEKIGQKFIVGVNSYNTDIIVNLIKNYYIGGVILYKKNYKSYDEMLSLIKKFKKANSKNKVPLFIAVDQEGGRVNRMPPEFHNLKNIYDMSKKGETLISKNANITGKMLKEMGINMNFAPVLDMYDNDSKVLYKRCFSGDEDDVYKYGMEYVNGINNNGVVSVIKHFPGHGVSKRDSHFITPYVSKYRDVLEKHILPFEKAIKNNDGLGVIDAVMVGHLVIKNLTNGLPASISKKFISRYLREKYSFQGVIVTDEINMLSRNIFYRFNYVKNAFISGSDIILVRNSNKHFKMIEKCLNIVSKNKEYEKILDDSVCRILKLKEKYNVNDDISYVGCNVEEINKEIDIVNDLCNKF